MPRRLDLEPREHELPLLPPVRIPPRGENRDDWVAACGGTEEPFTVRGRRLHYMWNRRNGDHAYYDCDRDIFLTPEEYMEIING